MSIKVALLNKREFAQSPESEDFIKNNNSQFDNVTNGTEQNQKFQQFELQNGYGSATTVSVTPGFGATVTADIAISMISVTEQTFEEMIKEVKRSDEYMKKSEFSKEIDSATYSSAGSVSTGIFGWLLGSGSDGFSNTSTNLTTKINNYESGNLSNNTTVANSVADIMVKNQSAVEVIAEISVIGQLLVPSPTVITAETTTFTFTNASGNTSTVSMLNQAPLIPVDPRTGTVSSNIIEPGSHLTIVPIG